MGGNKPGESIFSGTIFCREPRLSRKIPLWGLSLFLTHSGHPTKCHSHLSSWVLLYEDSSTISNKAGSQKHSNVREQSAFVIRRDSAAPSSDQKAALLLLLLTSHAAFQLTASCLKGAAGETGSKLRYKTLLQKAMIVVDTTESSTKDGGGNRSLNQALRAIV